MRKLPHYDSAAEWYTAILKNARKSKLPPNYPQPQPPAFWPEENVALLERYLVWLYADNAGTTSIHDYYLPTAGHVLGYHLRPHPTLDLEAGLARVMDYFQAKQLGDRWLAMGQHALNRFRRFMHEERGYARLPAALGKQPNLDAYQTGLPDWLVEQLSQYQQIRQTNWRTSRLHQAIVNFWRSHTELWRWLFAQEGIVEIGDIERGHILGFIDERLNAKYNVKSINLDVRAFQATLRFLQEREYEIPLALLRTFSLREPDALPRFLTDEQVGLLQAELERCVQEASTPARKRNALLDRAMFYLLWQAGLRASEIEDMQLADLSLAQRQWVVRNGKGKKDRTVYLTERTCAVLRAYLKRRGSGQSDHLFLYRHEPLGEGLVCNRIKAAGRRARVKVTPHQLRHTYGTQLVNAGCCITTIQKLMGHKRLSTTLIYTHIHNHTVAEDYYAAMAQVEKKLERHLQQSTAPLPEKNGDTPNGNAAAAYLLTLATALQTELLPENQQALVMALRHGLKTLAETTIGDSKQLVVNEQLMRQTGVGAPP